MTVSQHTRSDAELELEPELEAETLKDLTPPAGQAHAVKGGDTGNGAACWCTTM